MVFVMPAPKTQAACTRNVNTLKLDTLAESFTLRAKQEGKQLNKPKRLSLRELRQKLGCVLVSALAGSGRMADYQKNYGPLVMMCINLIPKREQNLMSPHMEFVSAYCIRRLRLAEFGGSFPSGSFQAIGGLFWESVKQGLE